MEGEHPYLVGETVDRRPWIESSFCFSLFAGEKTDFPLGQAADSSNHFDFDANDPAATDSSTASAVPVVALLVMVVVCISFASAPIGLSPIGISTGQATNQTAEQAQTTNQSGASIEIANQTSNGSTVTIRRATLPEGGFLVLSTDPYSEIVNLEASMIAVSDSLPSGKYRNVTLDVQRSPPGGIQNRTSLNTTSDYSVSAYRDSNNNSQFDYIISGGSADEAYVTGTGRQERFVSDAALVTITGSDIPTPDASIRFQDQPTNGSSVTIGSVMLPDGGFVIVHNQSYLRDGDPLSTAIGLSRYLPAGTHRNVSVALIEGSVQQKQTFVAIPSRDTNGNETYDYIRSDGFQDVPYTAQNQPLTAQAIVSQSGGRTTTTPVSPSPSTTVMRSTSTTAASVPLTTDSRTPARTATSTPTETPESEDGVGNWLPSSPFIVVGVLAAVVVIVGAYSLTRRS